MKSRRPSLNGSQISVGFVSDLSFVFAPFSTDTCARFYHKSLTCPRPNPPSRPVKPPPPAQPPIPALKLPAEDESVVSNERQGARKLSIKGQHDYQRRKRKDSSPQRSVGSGASTPGSAAEDGPQPSNTKRLKKMMTTTTTEDETPSLLLRMGHPQHLLPTARGRKSSKSRSPPVIQSQRSESPRRPPPAGLPDLSLGISIKGAARSHSHSHPSLLERIQGGAT